MSLTSGNAPLLLRQCRQKPVLLPRLRPGRGPDPLCPAIPRSALPPNGGSSRTGTAPRSRFPIAGGDGRFLSASTAPPSGSCRLSGTSRSARFLSDRGTRHRLRSRRKLTASSGCLVLLIRSVVGDRIDQSSRPRCLLPAAHFSLPTARADRQPLWPQHRRGVPPPFAAALQRRIVRLGIRQQVLHCNPRRRAVRSGRAVAGRFPQHHLRHRHAVNARSVWLSLPSSQAVPCTSPSTRTTTRPGRRLPINSPIACRAPASTSTLFSCQTGTIPTATSSPAPAPPILPPVCGKRTGYEVLCGLSAVGPRQYLALSPAR